MLKRILFCMALALILFGMIYAIIAEPAETAVPREPEPSAKPVSVVIRTAEPTATPLPEVELGVREGEAVEHSYFDDAVFIGDSITLKLYQYVRDTRKTDSGFMGKARFLVAGSLGSANALKPVSSDSLHPTYKGEKMLLEDSVKAIGAKKIYIMLGANDVGLYGAEDSAENMRTLIQRILKKSPGAEVFVQSVTPRVAAMTNKPSNSALYEYNMKLNELCVEEGWSFIDTAGALRDEMGNLPDKYCSDASTMGIHLTDEACQIWIDYLTTHTGSSD